MNKKVEPKQDVAVAERPGDIALPPELGAFEQYAGAGMEKATSRDTIIPRLTILQSLSPQLKRDKGQYIEGAEPGDICDVGTGELMPIPLEVLPVVFDKVWIEWAPRSTGQGLVAIHTTDGIMERTRQNDKKQNVLENGNIVQETAQWYLMNMSAGRRPCFLPFVSTQLKKSRRWMTLAKGERVQRRDGSEFVPPLYYRIYRLATAHESNNQGDWYGWTVERGPSLIEYTPRWESILKEARELQESIIKGLMTGDTSDMGEEASGPVIDHENSRM